MHWSIVVNGLIPKGGMNVWRELKFAYKPGNDISGLALATWTQANLWLRFNSAVQRKYTQIISIYTNQFLAAQDFM